MTGMELLEALQRAAGGFVPAALGSFVAQVHERGLGRLERFQSYLAGILVSYYVTLGLRAWLRLDEFVAQAFGFVIAMIAFKSTPRFIAACSDAIAAAPGKVVDWLGPRKDKS